MSVATLEKKISLLPVEKQKEVQDFVDFLLTKLNKENAEASNEVRKSGFGALKGMFVMSDDFDEPLEDFKDYM
jgi:hypothetical protein